MRLRRLAVVGVTATAVVLVPMPATATSSDCTSFQSIGATSPNAIEYGLPYEIYGGVPYVETEMSSTPKARALASGAYPGQIGEILIGTSGAGVEDPTTREVFWPAVQGKKSTDGVDDAPATTTFATATPGPHALAWASDAGRNAGNGVAFGPSYATSEASVHGTVLSGHDESWSYDVQLGGARIDAVHSVIDYRTDGTRAGTTGQWRLDVLGIGSAGKRIASVSGDGISVQGSEAQPGPAARQQVQAASRQLSDALATAGVGRVDVSLEPGRIKLSAGRIEMRGAELAVKLQPAPTAGEIGQTAQLLLGYEERVATLRASSCGSDALPAISGLPVAAAGAPATAGSAAAPGLTAGGGAPVSDAAPPVDAPAAPITEPLQQSDAVPVGLPTALWPRRFYHWALFLLLAAAGALWLLYAAVHRPFARR
jgi:hypothetical protein